MEKTVASKKEIQLTLDGKSVKVPAGTTIIEAASGIGIEIPTLCYLKKVLPIASCRVCSVNVEGVASPVMSCSTPVSEGMKVTTQSDSLTEYRKNMIQFILVNHPLDCPVCERSGECMLQNKTYEFGITKHIWKTNDHKKVPVTDWNLLRYDKNLCILCERCVKICTEVQGLGALAIHGTGFESRIKPVNGVPLDCDFCGQCWSVCPVGAISSSICFPSRSWEVEKTETICPHCAVGCSFNINVKKEKIVRVTSEDNIGINNGNLCARGRFGYEFYQSDDRMASPLIREGHGLVATDWDTALATIADKLKEIVKKYGKQAVVGIGSERATNEANYVFQKFFRDVLECGNIDNMANLANPDVTSELFETFDDYPMTCSYDELKEGNLFVFIGAEGSDENPVVSNEIREAILKNSAEVAIAYSKVADFLPHPKLMLTYGYTEMHEFLVALLSETVKQAEAGGAMEGAVEIPADWKGKLEGSAGDSAGKLDDSIKVKISALVALTRKLKKPVYLIGQEAQHHPQGTAIVQNAVNLAKLTGGKVMLLREYCNTQGVNDMGVAPNMLPGYVRETRDNLKSAGNVLEMMENSTAKVLLVFDEDILRRYSDLKRITKAVKNLEFVVVIDQFYNSTCLHANVILPSSASAEKSGTFTNLEGRVQKLHKAIEPFRGSLEPWEIFSKLAHELSFDFPFNSPEDVTAAISNEVPLYKEIGKGAKLLDYKQLVKKKPALKWVEPKKLKLAKDDALMVLPDHSLFALGIYTDYCPSLRPLVGKHYADFHMAGKPYVDFHPEDATNLDLEPDQVISFRSGEEEWKAKVRINKKVAKGSIRVPSEKDKHPSLLLVTEDHKAKCINYLGLME